MRYGTGRAVITSATIAALLGLGACSGTVDQFSNRAQAYNDQADTIKEQQLLLNILRAAYREPMEFSDFTQVTGQSSLSGTLGFSLPITSFPANAMRSYLTTPSATVSGTQSFTVANLDTQEFYEGLLSPVPLTTLDYYMESDYPKALVLTLFVDKIELMRMADDSAAAAPAYTLTYDNSYMDGRYEPFRAMINTAIFAGLDTETVKQLRPIGPPMTTQQLHEVKDLSALISEGVILKTYKVGPPEPGAAGAQDDSFHDPVLTAAQLATILPPGVTQYYRLISTSAVPRLCFDPAGAMGIAEPGVIAGINAYLHRNYALSDRYSLVDLSIPPSAYCGRYNIPGGDAGIDATGDSTTATPLEITLQAATPSLQGLPSSATQMKFRVVITTRSVEQILYYLGEWVRGEMGLDGAAQPLPQISTGIGVPDEQIAEAPVAGAPADGGVNMLAGTNDILFQVQPGDACTDTLPSVHVGYFNRDYCMQIDPSARDRSSQVMEIVSQLFALNNSAKNLPSPNVISVLAP